MDFPFVRSVRWLPWAGLVLVACTPALNWRQVAVAEAGLELQFPCKPQRQIQTGIGLLQCEAAGTRFVVGWRAWPEPASVQRAIARAAAEAGERMATKPVLQQGASVPQDALSWPGTGRFLLESPRGRVEMLIWARGLTAYQAYVITQDKSPSEAARLFLDSVRGRT